MPKTLRTLAAAIALAAAAALFAGASANMLGTDAAPATHTASAFAPADVPCANCW